jgi:hypothetical protein
VVLRPDAGSWPPLIGLRDYTIGHITLGRVPLSPTPENSTWQYAIITTDKHQCPPAGFEATIPASERPRTHALDRVATRIG